jgi:hypothetical protein
MDTVTITKTAAASRQLDAAIRLLFSGGDILAVHTLAGAASHIISDLNDQTRPDASWDKVAQTVCGLDAKTYFKIMRATQNFLKHADRDADVTHEFTVSDTLALIASAVFNFCELTSGQLTIPQSVFQLWHLACNLDVLDQSFEHRALIKSAFKDLSRRTPEYRLSVGWRELNAALARE